MNKIINKADRLMAALQVELRKSYREGQTAVIFRAEVFHKRVLFEGTGEGCSLRAFVNERGRELAKRVWEFRQIVRRQSTDEKFLEDICRGTRCNPNESIFEC